MPIITSVFKKIILCSAIAGVFMLAVYPSIASAQTTTGIATCSTIKANGLKGVVLCFMAIVEATVTIIMVLAVVVIMWGAFKMIYSEEKRKEGRDTIIYGIIGLFAMISIWGFVNILDGTFRLSGPTTVTAPTIRLPGLGN